MFSSFVLLVIRSFSLSPVQLEVLPLLSPKQIAGMLLLPLPTPPEKDIVIDRVFDFLFESPEDARLPEVLHELLYLINKVTALQ